MCLNPLVEVTGCKDEWEHTTMVMHCLENAGAMAGQNLSCVSKLLNLCIFYAML